MTLRFPWLLLLAALGAALLWWTWPRHALPYPAIDWKSGIQRGDQAASDVVLREYDAEGALRLLARAQTAYHLPAGNRTYLSDLSVQRFRSQGNFSLQAAHGLLQNGDQELTVWGQVLATLAPDNALRTDKLYYDPKTGILRTSSPVYLTHGRSSLQGTGLWASIKQEQFQLQSGVQGVYEP
ncbi:MAG: LPS export ABC transporter periplasmic protein LptC [Candidatus Igneacidithiobacillus chanchocoensis]